MKLGFVIITLSLLFCANGFAKVKKENVSEALLQKVLAENGIFRCSFNETVKSDLKGDKLKTHIKKNCKEEVSKINQWYKDKEFNQRADLLISNGMRSALSHKKKL